MPEGISRSQWVNPISAAVIFDTDNPGGRCLLLI